jgi:hypothetical protein
MADADNETSEIGDGFSQRLTDAVEHLSDGARSRIRSAMESLGIEGGIKGGIARLCGMNTPSLLSDMLAGRSKGMRYRASLAEVLEVDEAWLDHGGGETPEWALLPLQAWERWYRQARIAWQAWFADRNSEPSSSSLFGLRVGADSRFPIQNLGPEDRSAIARHLDLDPDGSVIDQLAQGQWHEISFDLLLEIAKELGAAPPKNPQHVRRGHAAAGEAAAQRDLVTNRFRNSMLRYHLPPRLFQLCRLALVSLKQQHAYQGKDTIGIDDTIELLWRQQFQNQERGLDEIPENFQEETGRKTWTSLEEIMKRYESETTHPDDRFAD